MVAVMGGIGDYAGVTRDLIRLAPKHGWSVEIEQLDEEVLPESIVEGWVVDMERPAPRIGEGFRLTLTTYAGRRKRALTVLPMGEDYPLGRVSFCTMLLDAEGEAQVTRLWRTARDGKRVLAEHDWFEGIMTNGEKTQEELREERRRERVRDRGQVAEGEAFDGTGSEGTVGEDRSGDDVGSGVEAVGRGGGGEPSVEEVEVGDDRVDAGGRGGADS